MVYSNNVIKMCLLFWFFQIIMPAYQLYGMELDVEVPVNHDSVILGAQQRYVLARSLILDILDGHEIPDISVPYRCFQELLAIPGDQARECRAHAAHKLGLMCKTRLGVPESDNGIEGAERYFSVAVDNGHIPSVGELARCARERGNYTQAVDLWRQERFLEISRDCSAQISQMPIPDVRLQDQHILDDVSYAIGLSALLPTHVKQQRLYLEAANDLFHALEQAASHGNMRAHCLIARFYASMPDNWHLVGNVTKWLAPVLSSCSCEQIAELISSTKAQDALKLMAQTGDIKACTYLGILLYNEHKYDEAYCYCHKASQQNNPYAVYCCAQMLFQGRGTERSVDGAARMYAQVAVSDSIDDRMRAESVHALKEIARSGSIAGACELMMAFFHESVSVEELKKCIKTIFDKPLSEQAEYISYMHSPVWTKFLMKAKKEGNLRAMLMLGALQAAEADSCSKIDKKIQLFQSSFDLIKQAHQHKLASDSEMSKIALCLGVVHKDKGSCDRAKEFFEYAAKLGNIDAKCAMAQLLVGDKKSSRAEIESALGFFEESALQGNVNHQRLLAQLYRNDFKFQGSPVEIKADVGKSYKFATMLLDSKPDDVEGRFIVGTLLGTHGGQSGIPANQTARAYELLSSAVEHTANVLPVDYYLLGRLSFANGDYAQAMSWFDRAGDFPTCTCYRGLIMLIEAEKGNKHFDKTQGVECIAKVLSAARKYVVRNQPGFCELFRHEPLIRILKQDADSGDRRARAILARIVYLFQDETLGISKQTALAYLVEAAHFGDASALSYLGFMHYRACGVARSDATALDYFIQALHMKVVPNFVYDEIREELFAMARVSDSSPISITAAYHAIPIILRVVTPENVKLAISLMNKAEADFVNNFVDNKPLAQVVYDSGAWAALKTVADKGEGDAAAVLGLALVLRFVKDITDFDRIRSEGFSLLEQALHCGSTIINATDVGKKYLQCTNHALRRGLRPSQEMRIFLEHALQLDPKNQEIAYTVSTLYRQHLFPGIVQEESFKKGSAMLEELAEGGHQQAALEAGLIYLMTPAPGNTRSNFIRGVRYLNIAARKGSYHAICVLVSALISERDIYAKRTRKDTLETIEFLLGKAEASAAEKVFLLGLKAMANHQGEKALACFIELGQDSSSALLLAEAAMIWFPLKDGYLRAGGLLLKAIEIAGDQHIDIKRTGMAAIIRNILTDLDKKAEGDLRVATFVASLRSKLQHYNYTI